MKEKIKMLVLGIIIGAVITAGIFILLKPNNLNQKPNMDREMMQFDGAEMPEDMQGRRNRDNSDLDESSLPEKDEIANTTKDSNTSKVDTEKNNAE